MTLLIGDVHGKWHLMDRVVSNTTQDVVCVGDVGIGFAGKKDPVMPSNFKFIRGNHDNPEIISKQPGFLGDYGMTKYPNRRRASDSTRKGHGKIVWS